MSPPPQAFLGFRVAFDTTLYSDTEPGDALTRLDRCIAYGLQWHDRASLQSLRDYLDTLLSASDANGVIVKAWNSTKPRVVFRPSGEGAGVASAFERVRDMAAAKLDELGKN